MVLFTHTTSGTAHRYAEMIRSGLTDRRISHVHSPTGFLTLSVGVIVFDRRVEHELTFHLGNPDRMLYQAKRSSRNKVVTDDTTQA